MRNSARNVLWDKFKIWDSLSWERLQTISVLSRTVSSPFATNLANERGEVELRLSCSKTYSTSGSHPVAQRVSTGARGCAGYLQTGLLNTEVDSNEASPKKNRETAVYTLS